MKSIYRLLFVFFFVMLFSCQQQHHALTEVEKEAVTKEVKNQFNNLVSACDELNAAAWSEFYSQTDFISAIGGANYFATRSAWVDSITLYFSMRASQKLDLLDVQVTVLAPNLALLTSEENIEMVSKGGKEIKWKHAFSMIWKKEQSGWKIIHSHESWAEN